MWVCGDAGLGGVLISSVVQHSWSLNLNCCPKEARAGYGGKAPGAESTLACSTRGDGDPMHLWAVGSTEGCSWLWGAPTLLPCLAPLSPKPPVSRAKVEPSVLLLQVEGTMPRMDGLAGAMPGMSWREGNKAGDIWLSRTNARDVDGWDNTRHVWLSRDDARDAWPGSEYTRDVGGNDTRDIQLGKKGGCMLGGLGVRGRACRGRPGNTSCHRAHGRCLSAAGPGSRHR